MHDKLSSFSIQSAKLTWLTKNPSLNLYNNDTACDALVKKGIKKILFSGDSYMRQIYAATLITLKGDYLHGSIDPNNQQAVSIHPIIFSIRSIVVSLVIQISYCQYHRQFFEKRCGTHSLIHYAQVCDGRIVLVRKIKNSLHSSHLSLPVQSVPAGPHPPLPAHGP